jgi:RNA polymerase sigma-70 factor (ECF subfamily)
MHATPTVNAVNEQEVTLLKRVAEQDKSALTELFLSYQPRLFKFVFRLTQSYTIADEMVNDIMLLIWQKAANFRGESKVSTWIFGIAYRQTMRRVTRNQLQVKTGVNFDDFPMPTDTGVEQENWVQQGVQSLPATQRIAVELVFFLGLSYREVAEITDSSINTVKTRMFHARKKLKHFLTISAEPVAQQDENAHD